MLRFLNHHAQLSNQVIHFTNNCPDCGYTVLTPASQLALRLNNALYAFEGDYAKNQINRKIVLFVDKFKLLS